MEAHLTALLAEIAQHGREHDASETDHTKKMLNLDPDTARLVLYSGAQQPGEVRCWKSELQTAIAPSGWPSAVAAERRKGDHNRPQRGKAGHGAGELAARRDCLNRWSC